MKVLTESLFVVYKDKRQKIAKRNTCFWRPRRKTSPTHSSVRSRFSFGVKFSFSVSTDRKRSRVLREVTRRKVRRRQKHSPKHTGFLSSSHAASNEGETHTATTISKTSKKWLPILKLISIFGNWTNIVVLAWKKYCGACQVSLYCCE